MAKKNITIEDLVVITKNGFNGVDKRFGTIDKQLKEIKDTQERMELRLDNVAYRFELVALEG